MPADKSDPVRQAIEASEQAVAQAMMAAEQSVAQAVSQVAAAMRGPATPPQPAPPAEDKD